MNQGLGASTQWVKKKRTDVKKLKRVRRAFYARLLGWGVREREEGETKGWSREYAEYVEGIMKSLACLEQKGQG